MAKKSASSLEMTPMMGIDEDSELDNFDLGADLESDLAKVELDREAAKYGKKKSKKASKSRMMIMRKAVALISVVGVIVVMVMSVDFNFASIKSWFHSAPQHDAFKLIESQTIKEYNAKLHLYRHVKTQAEFLSFIFKDKDEALREDKAFGISFRTVPTDSKGTAHILEHSVLQGSHKYPVKDPFLHMMKGSLNTYLNAMTYNDRTVYPIASRNSVDYLNLLKVYLDAVFYPMCVDPKGKFVFEQEGWRFGVSDNIDQTLEYHGVVYSEMKGVYSNPISVLEREAQSLLFPDNTYHFDSGGHPKEIPNLTYKEFARFYHRHYHPSNAQIFASGTAEDVLAAMEATSSVLKNFDYNEEVRAYTAIPYQKKTFTSPHYKVVPFAATSKEQNKLEAEKGQGLVSLTWLLNDKEMDPYTDLLFTVLEYLLLGTDSAPLKKSLEHSNLGDSIIASGYGSYLLQSTFSVGLKDVSDKAQRNFNKLVMETLQGIAQNGFDSDDIEAAINTIEFSLRECNTGYQPKSMIIFLTILQKWNYDYHPASALEYEDPLNQIKEEVKSRGSAIFQEMIKTYLLENVHRVVLELLPSETYEEEQLKEEKDRLEEYKSSLSADQFQEIVHGLEEFKRYQEQPDSPHDLESIPSLSMKDIDKKVELYPSEIMKNAYGTGITILRHEVPSSQGILYADFGLDISNVSFDDIELLPLLCNLMGSATKELPEDKFHQAVGLNTGGISVSLGFDSVLPSSMTSPHVTSGKNFKTLLFIKGKSTVDKASEMFDLFTKIIYDADFDRKDKVTILFNEELSLLKTSVPSSGHQYANRRIKSRYNPLSFINEMLFGVSSFERLERLQKQLDEDWEGLLNRLKNVLQTILKSSSDGMILNLTSDEKGLKSVETYVNKFVSSQLQIANEDALPVPDYRVVDHPWASKAFENMYTNMKDEGVVVSTQVSYVGKGGLLWENGDEIKGSVSVVAGYLKNGYLWDTVRVKNGAYGAMSSLSLTDGLYVMVSYRDPNLGKTIEAFDAAGGALSSISKSNDLTVVEVNNAIIGAIGSLDGSALPPNQIGWNSYLEYATGKDSKYRQQWRNEILSTQKADFIDFASRLVHWKKPSVAVISSQNEIEAYKNATHASMEIINLT